MFPSNFIREIKNLVFCGTVIFCGIHTTVQERKINTGNFHVYHVAPTDLVVTPSTPATLSSCHPAPIGNSSLCVQGGRQVTCIGIILLMIMLKK